MTLIEVKDSRSGKMFLQLRESYRNKERKPAVRCIKNYGIVTDENRKQLYILALADKKQFELEHQSEVKLENIKVRVGGENSQVTNVKNFGYIVLDKIYKTLGLDKFIKTNIRKRKDSFDTNNLLRLLTFSRILKPDSKLETFKKSNSFFEKFNVKLDNVYDVLDDLFNVENSLQLHMHQEVSKIYKRDLNLVFYDVTNYFFEIDFNDEESGLRASGVSKEKRTTPIIQMGLLMDQEGIPIAYKLFRGNTHDTKTLISAIEEFQKIFNVHSIKLIADKGLNSGANLEYLVSHNHQFIVSQKVRGKSEKFIDKILDENDYVYMSNNSSFKIKDFKWSRKDDQCEAYLKTCGKTMLEKINNAPTYRVIS